jgi:hypothetical protein
VWCCKQDYGESSDMSWNSGQLWLSTSIGLEKSRR